MEDYQKADDQEKFEDLQDICHYYLAYLEEESEGAGANVNNLKEIKATKARMEEKGFLAPKFNSKSILARVGGPQEPPAEPQKLGGIGRKRQNTESIQQLESQIS